MKILIADDSDAVRRGVIRLLSLNENWAICGEARDGSEAIAKARELRPDLVILDIRMPELNGLEAAAQLHREFPEIKILIMSQHDPAALLARALAAGANGCVDKGRLGSDLSAAILDLCKAESPAASADAD